MMTGHGETRSERPLTEEASDAEGGYMHWVHISVQYRLYYRSTIPIEGTFMRRLKGGGREESRLKKGNAR